MITDSIKNEYASVHLIDGILTGVIKAESVDLKVAKAAVALRLEKFNDKDYPFLINIKQVKFVSKEARDFLASETGCEKVAASAILINSAVASMLGNFFMRINRPYVPTKLFTNEEMALAWLSTFK